MSERLVNYNCLNICDKTCHVILKDVITYLINVFMISTETCKKVIFMTAVKDLSKCRFYNRNVDKISCKRCLLLIPIVYCNTQLWSSRLQCNGDPPPLPFPSPILHVFVRIIIRSVRMLGRRTFGVTTPHASLSRRFTDNVYRLLWWEGADGGSGHGEPKFALIFLWWFGAISRGSPATTNSW